MSDYKETVGSLLDAVRSVAEKISEKELEALTDCILSGHKIFIYGSGRSGLVGQYFSVRLVQLGCSNVHFIGDMTTPIIGKDDTVILISNTGETVSAVQTANIARRMGSKVISITASKSSKLAHASNVVILLDTSDPYDRNILPLGTLFEDAVIFMFDALVPTLMKRLNSNEEDMRKRHAIWV